MFTEWPSNFENTVTCDSFVIFLWKQSRMQIIASSVQLLTKQCSIAHCFYIDRSIH